jgi:CBS-domain-containing membrane protein
LLGILGVALISRNFLPAGATLLILSSMGSSAVMLFAVPHSPMSQPWPVLGGHLASATVGVFCVQWVPNPDIAAALAVALAIGAMHYLRCIHAPGGATALAFVVGGDSFHALGFQYIVTPTLLNVMLILLITVVFNYAFPWRRYPACLAQHGTQKKEPHKKVTEEDTLTRDELEKAVKSRHGIAHISRHELEHVYDEAKQNGRSPAMDPMSFRPGKYYSNGCDGPSWQVRQVIDSGKPSGSGNGQIKYQIVAGDNRNTAGTASHEDFARWARHEVFLNENSWVRLANDPHEIAQT